MNQISDAHLFVEGDYMRHGKLHFSVSPLTSPKLHVDQNQ